MLAISEVYMNTYALGLALILVGIVLTALGGLNVYYNKIVFRSYEIYDAVITKLKLIKGKSYNPYESIQIYAEYTVDGVLITGHYYTILTKSIVKFNVGETVEIQVNPDSPSVFRIQSIEDTTEMENTRKRSPILTICGIVVLIIGIAILLSA